MNALSAISSKAILEMGNSAAVEAAKALSALAQVPVSVTGSDITVVPIANLWRNGKSGDTEVISVHMGIGGGANGSILVMFDRAGALKMVTSFLIQIARQPSATVADVEMTMLEFGNIVAGTYLTAIGTKMDVQLTLTTPRLIGGTASAALREVPMLTPACEVIVIESGLRSEAHHVRGQVILIPDTDFVPRLLQSLA